MDLNSIKQTCNIDQNKQFHCIKSRRKSSISAREKNPSLFNRHLLTIIIISSSVFIRSHHCQQDQVTTTINDGDANAKFHNSDRSAGGDHEIDPFVMQSSTTATNEEELTTTQATTTSTGGLIDDDGRIAINASRQQFITHDQLNQLNGATKDEPISLPGNEASPSAIQRVAQTSRAGMSRLASSFGLSDLISRYTRPRQQSAPTTRQPVATEEQNNNNNNQQQCPGVCLDILSAAIRCKNAIATISCPSIFQKCCELDDVSFNGTPVETSAPIPSSDADANSVPSVPDVRPGGDQGPGDGQPGGPTTLSPTTATQTTTTPTIPASVKQQVSTAEPNLPPDGQPTVSTNAQSSVYFLSSGNDDDDAEKHDNNNRGDQHLALSKQQQPATNLAQPAGDQQTGNSKFKLPASQSFDLPLTTSTSTQAPTINRIVALQTANGTTYLPQQQIKRPIYANLTDYQLLMMQNRQQHHVVYHSNIDPVRKFTETTPKSQSDLTNNKQNGDQELKVLKDQHSAKSGQRVNVISTPPSTTTTTTQPPPSTTTTSTTTTTTTTTERPQITTTEQSAQDAQETAGQPPDQQSPVNGIASVLSSLFDAFITSGSSSTSSDQQPPAEEARGPQPYQPDLLDSGAGAELAPSFVQPDSNNNQQNDRRLGLDLSFRQQNEQRNQTSLADAILGGLMTSDGGSEQQQQPAADEQQVAARCNGYCAMDQFVGLCDYAYLASECGPSKKCCVSKLVDPTGPQMPDGHQQQQQHQQQEEANKPQPCRGTCLPIYHSSLCTKPNELQVDSPTCLPNQVCCAPSSLGGFNSDANNHIDMQQEGQASQSGDSSLVAALLPPPPPTVASPNGPVSQLGQTADNQQANSRQPAAAGDFASLAGYSMAANPRGQPPTARPLPKLTGQTATSNANNGGGGIMNQIFQMFKSNTGLGKTRTRHQQQQQPQAQPILVAQLPVPQAQPIYEIQQAQAYPMSSGNHLISSGSVLRPQQTIPPAGHLFFGPIHQQQQQPMQHQHQQQQQQQQAQRNRVNPSGVFVDHHQAGQYPALIGQDPSTLYQHQGTLGNTRQQLSPANNNLFVNNQMYPMSSEQQQQHSVMANQAQMSFVGQQSIQNIPQVTNNNIRQPQLISSNGFSFPNQQQNKWTYHPAEQAMLGAANGNAGHQLNKHQFVGPTQQQQQYSQFSPANQQPIVSFGAADAAVAASSMNNNNAVHMTNYNHLNKQPYQNNAALTPIRTHQTTQATSWVVSPGANNKNNEPTLTNVDQRRTVTSGNRSPVQAEVAADANVVSAVSSTTGQSPVAKDHQQVRQQPVRAHQQQPIAVNKSGGQQKMTTTAAPARVPTSPNREQQAAQSSNVNVMISSGPHESTRRKHHQAGSSTQSSVATPATQTGAEDNEDESGSSGDEQGQQQPTASDADQHTFNNHTAGVIPIPFDHNNNNNKLDLNQATSEEISGHQQPGDEYPSSSSSSTTLNANTVDPQEEQQHQSSPDKPARGKVQATACGLPGPLRRRSSGRARGRVMGGFDSEPGYWCWQAALMNGKNEYLCGGALIGTKWVLTAAHCVTQHLRSESPLYVRLGQWNLNSSSPMERRSAKSVLVKTSYVHHNHNGITLDNDIALLRLADQVDLDEPNICTVCLPERSSHLEAGKRCTVTGYGYEQEEGPAALRVRQTDLPIVNDQECQNKTSAVLGKPFSLPASSFCAGGELGQDACHGDGGSPLSCLVDGYYELTGIVSWGYKCGNKDLPGLYAKVTNFVGWINQIVSVNN